MKDTNNGTLRGSAQVIAERVVPSTTRRVARNTPDEINRGIEQQIEASVRYYAEHPEQIGRRLAELDREWDIERVLETGSSALTLGGLIMGIGVSRKWLLLSLAVQGFFMQHALQGWCPPLPLLRRLGVRTSAEIHQEIIALRILRGDFLDRMEYPEDALASARMWT